MIDAPAPFPSQWFELTSVWNVVRELLTLSKQCMASRSLRLAPTFVHGNLVFLSSKVYMFTYVTSVLVYFPLLMNGLTLFKLEPHRGRNFLSVCNCDMLSKGIH